jgi:hypothetical protein
MNATMRRSPNNGRPGTAPEIGSNADHSHQQYLLDSKNPNGHCNQGPNTVADLIGAQLSDPTGRITMPLRW